MRLHWLQVRRARGLPMPLPPKPKRPLGPPVLFNWNGIDVRTRGDIEKAGYTWDEFRFGQLRLRDGGIHCPRCDALSIHPADGKVEELGEYRGNVRTIH